MSDDQSNVKGNVPLKRVLNPKPRGNIVELEEVDLENVTPREKALLRIIDAPEEQLNNLP
ncbi:hypothetical protein [Burkholderia cenocepacia]|uniref:hypothetical protein n=1 Tax=Burkholderia cenocepacia TaxID=95486 RepID=UPI000A455F09|nr:hypothetical protein [Burkholderia cenocepacia]